MSQLFALAVPVVFAVIVWKMLRWIDELLDHARREDAE